MNVQLGKGMTEYGPGVEITLNGDELALAITAYLSDNGIMIRGPRTVTVNGQHCAEAMVYVDPSGTVVYGSHTIDGRGNIVGRGGDPTLRT